MRKNKVCREQQFKVLMMKMERDAVIGYMLERQRRAHRLLTIPEIAAEILKDKHLRNLGRPIGGTADG